MRSDALQMSCEASLSSLVLTTPFDLGDGRLRRSISVSLIPGRRDTACTWTTTRWRWSTAAFAVAAGTVPAEAIAQACPNPVVVTDAQCTVAPATTINVTTVNGLGLAGAGPAARITADGVSVNLNNTGTTGALAQQGASILFNDSTLNATVGALGSTAGRIGLRAAGAGSSISATNATISMGLASATGVNLVGALADAGGIVRLSGSVTMNSGANGTGVVGIRAVGTGSLVTMSSGSITATSRGALGAFADVGGTVELGNGVTVTTSGAQTSGTDPRGSHALWAAGTGALLTGTGVNASTSGTLASAARAELGGVVRLANSTLSATGAGSAAVFAAGAAAVSGGQLTLEGSSVSANKQFGYGLIVQGAGSSASVTDTRVEATGNRSIGLNVTGGGSASLTRSTVTSASAGVTGGSAVIIDGAGSTASLVDSQVLAAPTTATLAYGVRALNSASVTLSGGSVTTQARDGTALAAGGSTIRATDLTITTTGTDNSMGALADGNSLIELTRGSVSTSGDEARAGARAHGLAARNPGGNLVSTGTSVRVTGLNAMGAVTDDGGSMTLSGNSIRTEGAGGIGLFAVVEQAGSQFVSTLAGNNVNVETLGLNAHGALASRSFLDAPASITLTGRNTVTTHGDNAVGLRAIGGGTVDAAGTTVHTEGLLSHGMLARDNPSAVLVQQSAISAVGANAHGAVVETGGRIMAQNATVSAQGVGGSALYAAGAPGRVPMASFSASTLTSQAGPAIAIGGPGSVGLSSTNVSSASGEWLRVATVSDFPLLSEPEPPRGGVGEFPAEDPAPPDPPNPPEGSLKLRSLNLQAPIPVSPGDATVIASASTLAGSAFTAAGSTSTVTLANGTVWNMTGSSNLTNLTNDGSQILFSPPGASGFKTLTVSNFTGANGAVIGLNTVLAGDGAPSDKLVITGGTAGGQTLLRFANVGGAGAVTQSNGIHVVDAINGGTTSATAFAMQGRAVAGPYEYRLFRASADASNPEAWYLRSEQTPVPPPDPTPPTPPAPVPPSPPEPPKPLYRPEIGAYLSNQRQAAGMFVHSLHDRLGEPQWVETQQFDEPSDKRRSGWLRVVGKDGGTTSRDGNFDVDTRSWLIQGGGDVASWQVFKDKDRTPPDRLHLGLMLGYGSATSDASALGNPHSAKGTAEGWSVGVYGTWYQNDADPQKLGWYADLWGTYGWYKNKVQGDLLPEVKYDANALTLSGETGYAMRVRQDSNWIVEPQAQLIYIHYSEDDITEPNGTAVSGSDGSGWISRLGVRLHRTWVHEDGRRTQPYLTLNWWHDNVDNDMRFNALQLGSLYPSNRYEVKLGVNAQLDKGWTGWANLGYQWGSQSYSNVMARIGAKYTW